PAVSYQVSGSRCNRGARYPEPLPHGARPALLRDLVPGRPPGCNASQVRGISRVGCPVLLGDRPNQTYRVGIPLRGGAYARDRNDPCRRILGQLERTVFRAGHESRLGSKLRTITSWQCVFCTGHGFLPECSASNAGTSIHHQHFQRVTSFVALALELDVSSCASSKGKAPAKPVTRVRAGVGSKENPRPAGSVCRGKRRVAHCDSNLYLLVGQAARGASISSSFFESEGGPGGAVKASISLKKASCSAFCETKVCWGCARRSFCSCLSVCN